MQVSLIFAFLLVASAASASSQPENVPVVGHSPSQVVAQPPVASVQPEDSEHSIQCENFPGSCYSPKAAQYSPSGLMQVIGHEQQPNKPGQFVRNYEQFGQPESASIPANYKPFGSWGLYIGGNPADGYYTNYYKALGSSVEKQQQSGVEQVRPVGVSPVASQTAAFSPSLRQAGGISSPFGAGADYYPFAYSPSDLSAASRSSVEPAVHSAIHSPGDSSYLAYADSYATKKIGSSNFAPQKEIKSVAPVQQQPFQQVQQQQQQAKGYYAASPEPLRHSQYGPVAHVVHSPIVAYQPQGHLIQHHPQMVSYPVPVGSQIVGSQPGIEGAFSPYGVHAFTKYAVKPTVVAGQHEPSHYYYSYPVQGVQSNSKQHYHQQQQVAGAPHYSQELGFYGYPVGHFPASAQPVHHQQSHSQPQPQHGAQSHADHQPAAHQQPPASVVEASAPEKPEEKPAVGGVVQK